METMLIQISISEAILWACLLLVLSLVGFLASCVFILMNKIKENTRLSHFTLIASAYSLIETKSIKHSDIIRKVVERHVPSMPPMQNGVALNGMMDEFNSEWETYLDPLLQAQAEKNKPAKAHPDDDFEIESVYDPALATKVRVEDLV